MDEGNQPKSYAGCSPRSRVVALFATPAELHPLQYSNFMRELLDTCLTVMQFPFVLTNLRH